MINESEILPAHGQSGAPGARAIPVPVMSPGFASALSSYQSALREAQQFAGSREFVGARSCVASADKRACDELRRLARVIFRRIVVIAYARSGGDDVWIWSFLGGSVAGWMNETARENPVLEIERVAQGEDEFLAEDCASLVRVVLESGSEDSPLGRFRLGLGEALGAISEEVLQVLFYCGGSLEALGCVPTQEEIARETSIDFPSREIWGEVLAALESRKESLSRSEIASPLAKMEELRALCDAAAERLFAEDPMFGDSLDAASLPRVNPLGELYMPGESDPSRHVFEIDLRVAAARAFDFLRLDTPVSREVLARLVEEPWGFKKVKFEGEAGAAARKVKVLFDFFRVARPSIACSRLLGLLRDGVPNREQIVLALGDCFVAQMEGTELAAERLLAGLRMHEQVGGSGAHCRAQEILRMVPVEWSVDLRREASRGSIVAVSPSAETHVSTLVQSGPSLERGIRIRPRRPGGAGDGGRVQVDDRADDTPRTVRVVYDLNPDGTAVRKEAVCCRFEREALEAAILGLVEKHGKRIEPSKSIARAIVHYIMDTPEEAKQVWGKAHAGGSVFRKIKRGRDRIWVREDGNTITIHVLARRDWAKTATVF